MFFKPCAYIYVCIYIFASTASVERMSNIIISGQELLAMVKNGELMLIRGESGSEKGPSWLVVVIQSFIRLLFWKG